MIEIIDYEDYRDFLKALFLEKKKENKKFSFQYCAKKLGTNRSYLKHVLDKDRNIGTDKIEPIADLFKLQPHERNFFTILVLKALLSDPGISSFLEHTLTTLRGRRREMSDEPWFLPSPSSDAAIGDDLALTLVCLSKFKGFEATSEWIENALIDPPPRDRIQAVLGDLIRRGILVRDGERWVAGNPMISSSPDPHDRHAFKIYRVGLAKVWKVLEEPTRHRPCQFFMGTFAINAEDERALLDLSNEFRRKVMEITQKSTDPDRILSVSHNLYHEAKRAPVDA